MHKKFKEIDLNKFSQQILPVSLLVEHKSQIETNNTARDRSRSENDLLENLIDSSVRFFFFFFCVFIIFIFK
jgi:hypothetical protein